jgi:hypothetical protein
MVRDQTYRRKKYEAKTDGDISEKRTDAYRDDMVSLQTSITVLLVQKEEDAKTLVLEPAGVPTSEIPFYLNFMRQACKTARNFSSLTKDNKVYSLILEYRDKGLNIALLYKLAALCGCYPEGYGYYM